LTTFAPLYVPAPLRVAVSDEAWLRAMLDAERALLPDADIFDPADYDIEALCEQGRADASPVVPLARALRERDPKAHGPATSQDVLDTAAMLVSTRARELVLADLDALCAACARLAETHRSTRMIARTLLQQAQPTTFGLKAAGWLVALVDARRRLATVVLPAQLGGPAGTLDPAETARFAAAVGLPEPVLPWHVNRAPLRELAAALDSVAGASAKVALDVVLLAQTEVGEVAEAEPGGSSSMPHKRNPAAAVLARASARLAQANAFLLAGGDYEHERAAGAWHAEWPALSAALAYTGGAVAAARRSLEGLEVDAARMGEHAGGGDAGAAEALVDRALAHYREQA
jgi:3-carboxy-cis,cis-muconate cycloisomerase